MEGSALQICKLGQGAYQDMRIITCDEDVLEGANWLCGQDARWRHVMSCCAPLPLRRKPDGFDQLLSAIVSQQVSTASAAAIWARVETAGLTTPERIIAASDEDLQSVGLSRPKIRYARALAEAGIDFANLRAQPTEAVIAELTAVSGIGPWTAEIYAMFSLGHADVFAHGDLALQEAARILFDLPARPNEKEMRAMARDWSPWRSVAARALWAYYRFDKNREGVR